MMAKIFGETFFGVGKLTSKVGVGLVLMGLLGCGAMTSQTEDMVSVLTPNTQWKTLANDSIELEIPPNYISGKPGMQLEEFQATLSEMGFGDRTDWLGQNAEKIELLAFMPAGEQLNVINVVQAGRSPEESIADYLQLQSKKLTTAGLTVTEQLIDADSEQGSFQVSNGDLNQRVYVYAAPEEFWVVTYSGVDEQFSTEAFERSRSSIQLVTQLPE